MRDVFEFVGIVVGIIVGSAASVFLTMALWAYTAGPFSCAGFEHHTGMSTSYDFWAGCFVELPDGRVLPEDIAREIWKKDYKVSIK